MTQFHARLAISLFVFFAIVSSACGRLHQEESESEGLDEKAAPYDQFSLQRSFPDRDFDWRGWRKSLSRLHSDFSKALQNNFLPDNNTADWTLQGPGNVGGRVNALAIKPGDDNTILAGFAAGGLFKSTDAGLTWKPVFDDQMELAIGDITFDPANPNIVYAGTGDPNIPAITFNGNGLYKSTDGGETWKYLALAQVGIISKVIIDPTNSSNLYVAAMGNPYVRDAERGIYKSTDGGLNWQKVLFVSDQAGASDLVINPQNPLILYASFWDRIRNNQESTIYGPHAKVYKSTDGGQNWVLLGGGLPTGIMGRTGLAISQQNPDKLYAVYVDSLSTPGGLYKSTDGGATWTSMNIVALEDACGDFGWYFGKIRVNPTNDEEVYFLAILLWKKAAGSTQWQAGANSHADVHELVFGSTGRRYLGCDGGVYRNDTGQMTWFKSNNLPTTQFYHTSYNLHHPNMYYAGAQDNGIRMGNGSGYNAWTSIFPADGFRCAFDPVDSNIFWVETQNGQIHKTIDGGNNWIYGSDCLGTTDRCNWDLPYMMSPHNPNRLYAGTYRMYFSENGSGWGALSGDLTDGNIYGARFHNITCVDESPVSEGKLLAGTSDGNVWRREPAGNWANITTGLPNRYVTSVQASPTLPNRIFVTHSGFRDNEYIPHIHRSDDNGQTWTDISGNLPNMPVNDIYILPGYADSVLFAATDAGVYFSRSSGQKWQRLGKNLPFIPVFDLERNPVRKELIAATHARGLWTFPVDSVFSIQPEPPANTVAVVGSVKTEDGKGIDLARVCDQPFQSTGPDGSYALLFGEACLNSGIQPLRNDDPLNGVSTFDLVLINKHILGLDSLDSPYKRIAADANNSRSITTFDIVTLRKLILGIDTAFTNTNSWRFIPADYVFPNPSNPFTTVFPEAAHPTIPAQPPAQPLVADFIGLKVGDVNGSVSPSFADQVAERRLEEWPVQVEDLAFEAGTTTSVVFAANPTDLAGVQFTVSYDPDMLDLRAIEPLAAAWQPEHFGIKPGGRNCFTVCFDDAHAQTKGIPSPSPLFQAIFYAKAGGCMRNAIQLGGHPTPALAFKTSGLALLPVIHWSDERPVFNGASVYPNPFGMEGVRFILPEQQNQEGCSLRIFDASGKIIYQNRFNPSESLLPATVFPAKGVYWYDIRQDTRRIASGKLVFTG